MAAVDGPLQVERLFDDGGTPPAIAGRLFEHDDQADEAPARVECEGQLVITAVERLPRGFTLVTVELAEP